MDDLNECILVVEDDAQIEILSVICFKQEGFDYRTTNSAQGALSILVSEQIDLMFWYLDYQTLMA